MAEQFANHSGTTLAAAITTVDRPVTFTLTSNADLPTEAQFRLRIDSEILLVSAVNNDGSYTASNVEDTAAATHAAGAPVDHILTAGALMQFQQDTEDDMTLPNPLPVTWPDALPVTDAAAETSLSTLAGTVAAGAVTVKPSGTVTVQDTAAETSLSTLAGAVSAGKVAVQVQNFPATQPVSAASALPVTDANLEAVISGGALKVAQTGTVTVTDAAAEASLATLAGAVTSAKVQVQDAALEALVSGGKLLVSDTATTALAALITSGKLPVTDALLEAIIASGALKTADQNLATAITASKVSVSDALLEALIQVNRLTVEIGGANAYVRAVFAGGQTLPSYGSSATAVIPAVTGKWIKLYGIQLQFDPNTYATTANYNDVVFQEGTNGALIAWDVPFYIPGTASAYTPMTLSQGMNLFTPPGFNYITTQSGVSINYGCTVPCTLGSASGLIVIYLWYRYFTSAPF